MQNKTRLLTPGPTQLPDRVRLAMARDMLHHRKPEFKKLLHDVQENLRTLFGTEQPVISLAASGSGAMTAAVANLFAGGETEPTFSRAGKPSSSSRAANSASAGTTSAPPCR